MKKACSIAFVFFAVLVSASSAFASDFKGILTFSINNRYFCTAFEVEDGIAVTAAHCIVGKNPDIVLKSPQGVERRATVKAKNDEYDLALLRYDGSFGGKNSLNSILSGASISVLFQQKDTTFDYSEVAGKVQATYPNAILLTAKRQEHKYFSGSPVLNAEGEVVGVVIVGAAKDNTLGLQEGQIVAAPTSLIPRLFPGALSTASTAIASK